MITYGSTTLTSYNTITKIEVYYYKSTSATSLSGGSWSTTKPTWENGKYIWQKIRTTYEGKLENGQYYSESDPVNITGQQGQQGEAGTSAYSYKLNASDTIVSVSKNGIYSTNSITFSATSKQGNENVNPYKGRFKIETTTDGITWTTQYTSSTNESSKTFTIPENITNIRCSLYQADGTTVLLDITSVSIVRDGTDATGLKDSIPFYLASDKETDITIYDEGWSTIRPMLDATNKYLWVYYLSRYSNGTTDPELIEVSGDIATFENNGDISPIYSTEVDIEPIQDLNGFDHAWNGGDGKNLLVYPYYSGDTYTSHGLTFTVEKYPNGAIKDVLVNGTSDASTFFNFSAWANSSSAKTDMSKYCGQSMILSGGTSDARIVMQYRKPNSTSNIYLVNDTGGSGVTFTVPDASDLGTWAIFISISSGLTFNNVRVYPMLRFASETDGTYEPYENICPIDGWNSVKIERTGKNLLGIKYPNRTNNGITFTVNKSEITVNGTATANAWSSANLGGITSNLQYKNLIPPGQYMLTGGKSTDKRVYLTGNYLNGKAITVVNDYGNGALYTFTDWAYIYPQVQITSGITVENEVFNIQLEATTTATEYEPYCGNSYEIDFPTEAGTIFKGKLIIDENGDGQLIQTHEYKTLVGNDVAGIATTENITRFYSNATYLGQDIISCDSYEINSSSLTVLNKIGKMSGDTRIFCTPTWLQGATTKAEAQALLDINPINIVIELAEPVIYYFTAKQILALLKTNHIYANTDNTTVRYYDNQRVTVPYIDYSATSAFEYSAEALGKINNLKIGGRNLFGIGSDCAVSLGGLIAQNFSIVTEDGYKCAHAIGALKTTAYIQSKIPFIPKPLERVVFSADIKIKNIELGTTNPMCEFYFSGQNIDGAWRTIKSAETYVDGELISIANRKFNTILNSNEWHRVTVKAQFPDVIYTNNILPAIYLRDSTGEIFVKNVKYERGTQATDWTPAPEDVENSIKAYTESIQSQVDGMAEIHYGTVVPTLSNTPYTSWEDTETKDMHLDDLYYNTSTGYCYRFTKSGSTYSWTRIKDSDITAAATAASNANTAAGNAQTTANNANTLAGQKRRIFVAQPAPPYEVGDLWVEGSNGDIKKCKTARATGSYTASDWELASKYTDDTLANEANDKIDNLEIGGRNYKQNSNFNNNLSRWTLWNSPTTVTIEKIDNKKWAVITKNSSKNYSGISYEIGKKTNADPMPLQSGDTITISLDGQLIEGEGSVVIWIHCRSSEGGANITQQNWIYPLTETANRFSATYTIPSSSTYAIDTICVMLGVHGENISKGQITNVKVEKGNKPTDWSPAPEDITRGTGFYAITTAPSVYTTKVNDFTPSYRIALSTVKSESGLEEVMIGDVIQQGYNTYPVGYIDASYVYLGEANSIRGATGAAGLNTARVILYRRFASAPTGTNVAPTGDVTYTFATGVAENNLNSWTQAIPSGTDPVYMITASASSTNTTDTIPKTEWSAPVKILENGTNGTNGTNGADGYNQATIYLYQRKSGTAPSKPSSAVTYTFSTGALSSTPTGWSRTIPVNDGNPCYVTTAVAFAKTTTYSIPASGWSDVVVLSQDGEDGVSVTNVTSTNNTADGGTSVITITLSDGTTKTFNVKNGATGATAQWYYGTALTHTSGTATLVATSTSGAVIGSMYLNTKTSLVYKCTAVGTNNTWTYAGDLTTGVIDNIEIGGANLLRGASIQDVSFGNYKNQVTATEETLFGCTVFKSSLKWADIGFNLRTQVIDKNLVKAGDVLTYSIWAKTDDTTSQGICGVWVGNYISGAKITDLTSEWTQYYKTFTITQAMIDGTDTVPTRFECNTDCTEGKFVYWAAPKLERGNKATDWSPASEDVQTGIDLADTANTKIDNIKKSRLGWKVNYSTYTATNNGECYFHGYDSNNAPSNEDDGIVEWNGVDLTITKGLWINPNTIAPYNISILHVYRTDVEPHHADVWWDETQKKWRGYMYKTNNAPDTVSDWIWNEATDCILATYVSPSSEGAIISAQLFNPPKKFSEIPNPNVTLDLIDDFEIGGRNLLKWTSSPKANGAYSIKNPEETDGWYAWNSALGEITRTNDGIKFTHSSSSGSSGIVIPLAFVNAAVKDVEYTLSFKYRTNLTSIGVPYLLRQSNGNISYNQVIAITPSETTWEYFTTKIQWTSTDNYNTWALLIPYSSVINGWIEIQDKSIKLEKGSKATDWSPAPEDTQAGIDTALAQSVEYIVGTQTASTGTWTGVTTDNELKIGKTIAYKLPYAGSGNASLVLTLANGSTTDAIPVYLNTTRVTTHFGANSVINMTYDGQYWRASSIPNTNNYDRRQHSNAITAKTAITEKHLIVGDSTGYQQITSTSGGSLEFDLGYPILWAYSNIAATKTSTATYEAYPSVNFSTSGTIQDGATNKMLWLKGTIRGNIFTLASTNFLTTQIPTSDDGMYYIPLGIMSSATAGYFSSSNRIYAYIDEEFQPLDNAAALKASSAYETAVQARSEIVQTQQTLSLQIRDISVGGANLFERTKTFEGTANQSTAHDSFTEFVYKDLTVKSANTITFGNQVVELSAYQYTDLTSNMWYSFSFYAKGNVDIGFMYAGTGNAVIDSIDVSWDDNTYTGFNTTSTSSNIIWLTPTSNWQRYSVVFHIEEQDITALHRLIGLYARPVNGYTELATENKDILITETGTDVHLIMEGNEVQICGYKLELGNKPTDWTPADNDKATYDNIISQINLSKEGIAIRADKIRLEGMITANEGFSIDEYGNMTANNGTFNGIFESYATEINENTFDLSINNGHIQFYNNDRTLTEDERYVGYIGGIRKNTAFTDGSAKNNDAITIGLYNNSDFLINVYDDNTPTKLCEILNYTTSKPTFNFWLPACIYNGNKLQMFNRSESHGSQIEFRRYSKNTGGYVSRGSLSLHPIQDNSDISDRLYLLSKNQGNDLAGDQFLYFAGKGLRYSSSGQPMRTGYVATDKYIVTQYFSLPNLTIAKNVNQNFTIDVSRGGYTPIMCIPKVGGGQNAFYLSIYNWDISGNIATIRTHNISSTYDVSNVTISLQVLYKLTY